MRQGEVLGLAADDIDFDKGIIRVRRQIRIVRAKLVFAEPKGRKTREVPLPSSVAERLREHIAEFLPRSISLSWETPTGKSVAVDLIIYGSMVGPSIGATSTRRSGGPLPPSPVSRRTGRTVCTPSAISTPPRCSTQGSRSRLSRT